MPTRHPRADVVRAWMPWVILSVFVFIWGMPQVKAFFDGIFAPSFPSTGLHDLVQKVPPVVAEPHLEGRGLQASTSCRRPAPASCWRPWSAACRMGYGPLGLVRSLWQDVWHGPLLAADHRLMLALGYVTRYSGLDATLGLAFANTGFFYPFFGTLMGWLGVALTGSDTASNVLFGGLQKVTAEQLGLTRADGGGQQFGRRDGQDDRRAVHRRRLDRDQWYGHEGDILRFVFFHSIALACLVGCW